MDDAVSFEDHLASLILQGFDGIRRGGPYDLPAYGQEGYQDSQQSWDQKHHRSQFSMVSIEIQVLHHGISRDRGSDQIGNKDPFDKIPGQQVKNYRIRSSQDFVTLFHFMSYSIRSYPRAFFLFYKLVISGE